MYDVVEKIEDEPVWKFVLLMREVVSLICAPKIHISQVLLLNRLVRLYIEDRIALFPSVALRPKHHFLLHYAWLIMQFGPLIHVWTMHLESKHSFFKRCIRRAQNYLNVVKTLSVTHQLYQSYLRTGPLVNAYTEMSKDTIEFQPGSTLFAADIVAAVEQCTHLVPAIQCAF